MVLAVEDQLQHPIWGPPYGLNTGALMFGPIDFELLPYICTSLTLDETLHVKSGAVYSRRGIASERNWLLERGIKLEDCIGTDFCLIFVPSNIV